MNMKAEFINSFLDATMTVLKTMASVEPIPGKPFIKKGSAASGGVSGIVGALEKKEGLYALPSPENASYSLSVGSSTRKRKRLMTM
jgi:chemotaxis protein CheX